MYAIRSYYEYVDYCNEFDNLLNEQDDTDEGPQQLVHVHTAAHEQGQHHRGHEQNGDKGNSPPELNEDD